MSFRCLLDTFKSGTSGYRIFKAIWEVWVMNIIVNVTLTAKRGYFVLTNILVFGVSILKLAEEVL